MDALRFTIDRLDFEVGCHPFAVGDWTPGALAEARKEMGYFTLAVEHALEVLDRGSAAAAIPDLVARVRAAAEGFLPETRSDALARAFRSRSVDLRQAAVMVIQQVSAIEDPVEAWALLTALDTFFARMHAAFGLHWEATEAVPEALQSLSVGPELRERIEEGLRYLFEAGLRLQDHLQRVAAACDPVERGA